jgi:hypothetical protein
MRKFYFLYIIFFLFFVPKINSQEIKNISNINNLNSYDIRQVNKEVNNFNIVRDTISRIQSDNALISTNIVNNISRNQPSIIQLSPLQFGSFVVSNGGGIVHISYTGERYATGNVKLLYDENIVSPAIFEVRAPSNILVQVVYDKQCILKNQFGNEIIVYLDDLNTGNLFITPENAENGFLIYLGGYIRVLSSDEALKGEYVGNINLNIIAK